MLIFNRQVSPSTKEHLDSQFTFASDLSRQFFSAVQRINELNIQAMQAALQDTLTTARDIWSAQNPYDALSIVACHVQPAAERLRAYNQHLTDIAARTQVDLTKTAETHMPEASRTASAMADEVARMAAEETQKAAQRQKAVLDKVASPIPKQSPIGTGSNVH